MPKNRSDQCNYVGLEINVVASLTAKLNTIIGKLD